MEGREIVRRSEVAFNDRLRFEPMFDDAMRLTMPGRKRFTDQEITTRGDEIFDETGANALAEFVSRIMAGAMPQFSEFLRLEADTSIASKDREAINRDLAEISEYAFERIWQSNFAQEASEAMYDMALTVGVLNIEDGRRHGPLMHRAIPIIELGFERGPNDTIGGQFRKARVQPRHIPSRYPHAKIQTGSKLDRQIKEDSDQPIDVIEYTRQLMDAPFSYEFCVVTGEGEKFVERKMKGLGSNPHLTFRWQTTAGETWGRGPLLNALGAIRTTNLMVELILENAAMSIVGIYQTDNDATINADQISLIPGTILAREIGTSGLEPIGGPTGNFNMQDVVLGDQRLNIRKAMFNDMLSDPNKTPATATEVVERMADLAHRTAAGFGRLYYEMLVPYVQRVLFILEDRGDITMPTLNGQGVRYSAISPLAQAQFSQDMQKLVQGHAIRTQVYGPSAAAAAYNLEELVPWLNKREGLDDRLYASASKILEAMEQQAQVSAQMQMAAMQGNQGQ
jgi:hypothetical protein